MSSRRVVSRVHSRRVLVSRGPTLPVTSRRIPGGVGPLPSSALLVQPDPVPPPVVGKREVSGTAVLVANTNRTFPSTVLFLLQVHVGTRCPGPGGTSPTERRSLCRTRVGVPCPSVSVVPWILVNTLKNFLCTISGSFLYRSWYKSVTSNTD